METNQKEKLILIKTFDNSFEANRAKDKLADNGIEIPLSKKKM